MRYGSIKPFLYAICTLIEDKRRYPLALTFAIDMGYIQVARCMNGKCYVFPVGIIPTDTDAAKVADAINRLT